MPNDDQLLVQAFARIRPIPLGVSCGIPAGLVLCVATVVLLIKAAFDPPGTPVGPELALLGHFFPGYAVTWPGALLGAVYGFLSGFVIGVLMASLVNLNHLVYMRALLRKQRRRAIQDGL